MATAPLIDEKELLIKLRDGGYNAFEQIYRKYSPQLYGNLLRLTKSRDDAEDLLQELFLKLWQNRSEISPNGSLKSFLMTSAYNLFKNANRRLNIETQVEAFLSYSRTELYNAVEEQIYYKETDALLQIAISKLPPQRQKVYQLCKVEGLSYEEVAVMLGMATGTVHDHISKANKFIKQQLLSGGSAASIGLVLFSLFHT